MNTLQSPGCQSSPELLGGPLPSLLRVDRGSPLEMVSNFVKENARDEVIAEQRNTSTQHRGIGEDRVHKQLDPGRATAKGGMVGPE